MAASTSSGRRAGTSPEWSRNLARAIDLVDDPRCPGCLIEAIAALVDFDMALALVHGRRARPILLHDTFEDEGARRGLSNYIENTYVLNPVYAAHCTGLKQGVYRIRELAPDAYFDSEHYRNFKIRRLASEEIGYVTDSWPAGMEELVLAIERRDDDDLRHARDGLRPVRRRPGRLHGRWRDRRDGPARRLLRQPQARADEAVPQPDPGPLDRWPQGSPIGSPGSPRRWQTRAAPC